MAKFKFRLQSFLGVKEKIEEQKKNEYGKAIKILEEEKAKKQSLINQRLTNLNELKLKINTGINPNELQQYNNFMAYILKKIEEQDIVIEKSQKIVEKKREEVVNAMKERKMLEILKENKYVEYTKEEKKVEQKIIDEIVSFKYNKY